MDKNWSEMNKEMQALISKKATFREGISKLLELRKSLFEQITQIVTTFPEDAFYQMPFAGAEGYHSKTLAYSIWHIFRIEMNYPAMKSRNFPGSWMSENCTGMHRK